MHNPDTDPISRPSTPQLRLNGHPIQAPSSSASPSKNKMANKSKSRSGSSKKEDTLQPTPYITRQQQQQQQQQQQTKRKRPVTVYKRPSPFTQPIAYIGFLLWRIRIYFDATFSLGMLAEWEVLLVAAIATTSAIVLLYSLLFQFPRHIQTVMKRATYYLYGGAQYATQANAHHAIINDIPGGAHPDL
ncbi:unnamed protein product [Sympodiomycopsis kandeliae]